MRQRLEHPYSTGRIPRIAEVIFSRMFHEFVSRNRERGYEGARRYFYQTLRGLSPYGPYDWIEEKPWPKRLVAEAVERGDLDPAWVEAHRTKPAPGQLKTIEEYLRERRRMNPSGRQPTFGGFYTIYRDQLGQFWTQWGPGTTRGPFTSLEAAHTEGAKGHPWGRGKGRKNPLNYDESLRQLSRARHDLVRAQGSRGTRRALYAGRTIGRAGAVADEALPGSIAREDAARLQFDAATVGLTRRNPGLTFDQRLKRALEPRALAALAKRAMAKTEDGAVAYETLQWLAEHDQGAKKVLKRVAESFTRYRGGVTKEHKALFKRALTDPKAFNRLQQIAHTNADVAGELTKFMRRFLSYWGNRRNPLQYEESHLVADDLAFDSERAADTRDPLQRAYYAGRASGRARTVLNHEEYADTVAGGRSGPQFREYVRMLDDQAGVGRRTLEPSPRRNPRGSRRNPFALGEALATGAAFGLASETVKRAARAVSLRKNPLVAPFIYTIGNPGCSGRGCGGRKRKNLTHRGTQLAPVYQDGQRESLKLPAHLYRGTITLAEAIRRNIPGIRQAIKGFTKFHGGLRPDDEVVLIDDGRKDQDSGYLIGRSPEVTYTDVPEGSNKAGSPWGHETSKARPTYLAHSPRTGMTHLFGGMKATDWLRG